MMLNHGCALYTTRLSICRRDGPTRAPSTRPPTSACSSLVVASGVTERISERLADAGFDDVRDSHGYVVQGLLAGDTTVTAARRATRRERAGGVEDGARAGAGGLPRPRRRRRRPPGASARAHRRAARQLVDASRRARLAVARDLERWLGTRDTRRAGAPAPARGRALRRDRAALDPAAPTAVVNRVRRSGAWACACSPALRFERTRTGSPVSSMSENVDSTSSKNTRPSRRARWAPRQKCSPMPNERCGFGERWMSKRFGSSNTVSSRFADV